MAWAEQIDDYCSWLAAGNAAAGTIRLRRCYLGRLAAHTAAPSTVEIEDLVRYVDNPEWGAEARKSARSAVNGFFRWQVLAGRMHYSPATRLAVVRVPAGKPRPTPDVVFASALARAGDRDRLMLYLAAYAGLRCAEISRVHTRDIAGGSLRVHGKGGRIRDVPLHPTLGAALAAVPAGWVFPGRINGHLSPLWVSNLLGELLGDGWTAHSLRHRFASRCYAHQRDLRAVQELLGHASVKTTQIYTAVPDDAMRQAVLAVA